MSPNFSERVTCRYDNHALCVRFRENEIRAAEAGVWSLPDLDDLRRFVENFLIAVPGTPLILLHVLIAESVATLRLRISERSNRALEAPGKVTAADFWDLDVSEISPVSRALKSGNPVNLQNSVDGMPVDGGHVDGINVRAIQKATDDLNRLR